MRKRRYHPTGRQNAGYRLPYGQRGDGSLHQTLKPGEEKYSFTAMVPLNAKGVKLLSRKSFEAAAVSTFDNPLSSAYDENDLRALLRFREGSVEPGVCPQRRPHGGGAVVRCSTHVYQNYQSA